MLDGDGAVHAAGSRPARDLLIEVTDETGTPVSGATASFRLPDEGASGIFPNGLRTDLVVTDAQGRASLRGIQFNRAPGEFQIRITVAKDEARAGTVSTQYISESKSGNFTKQSQFRSGGTGVSHRTAWIVLGVLAAGAAVGAVAALDRGSSVHSTVTASPVSVPQPPSIGVPGVSIGKP